jgi:protein N-terminal amidase
MRGPDIPTGTGFASLQLPPPFNSTSIGICMDLNPEKDKSWDLLTGPYEIADHCIQSRSNLLIMLNSWLESSPTAAGDEDGAEWDTLEYWAARLRPLWAEEESLEFNNIKPQDQHPLPPSDTTVILCNRSGSEGGMYITNCWGNRY